MSETLLTPDLLAKRWSIRPLTLSQWRWNGKGPCFIKIGGRVLYPLKDIEEFEQKNRRQNTCKNVGSFSSRPSSSLTFQL